MCYNSKHISWQSPVCLANNSFHVIIHAYYQFLNSWHKKNCDINDIDNNVRHNNQGRKGALDSITRY